MIEFIKTWANQIIVAVIIATIFEMLLPNGNNKKYIKIVIGIYILFTVIQPIAAKITGKEISISSFDYEKYFDEDVLNTSTEDFENNNSNLIKQAYINNIKSDIQTKIAQKGYELNNCNIDIVSDETKEDYGAIENIVLQIEKIGQTESKNNSIKIEEVEVNINNSNEKVEESNITEKEKIELIEYLSEEYSIEKTKIVID